MTEYRCLVVGGGMAGGRAAEALGREAARGPVALVGAEPFLPYKRPDLSKAVLHRGLEGVAWLKPADFYAEQGIDVRLETRAASLDVRAREVTLTTGEVLQFEQLLICTGARPKRLAVPGIDLPGVHALRQLRDAIALAAELQPGRRAAIVGAGFVGCEVAAACRQRGVGVTMIELASTPCEATLGAPVGAFLASVHRAQGVDLRTGRGVVGFHGDERVTGMELEDGETLSCDFAVVGIGAEPATDWVRGLQMMPDGGLLVDERLETAEPGIFAVGDVACWPLPDSDRRIRVEHESNAQTQAMSVARTMLGRPTPYRALPYVWSQQYDLDLWAIGDLQGWDDVRVEEDLASRSLLATYVRGDSVTGVTAINRPGELERSKRLIGSTGRYAGRSR